MPCLLLTTADKCSRWFQEPLCVIHYVLLLLFLV